MYDIYKIWIWISEYGFDYTLQYFSFYGALKQCMIKYVHTDCQYYLPSLLRFDIYFPHGQAQWRQKYLSKLFKRMCSRCVKFLFYEHWTDKWKCFYIKYGSFGYSFCDKNCILRSVEERVNFELKWYQSFISQKRSLFWVLLFQLEDKRWKLPNNTALSSARNIQSIKILFLYSEK